MIEGPVAEMVAIETRSLGILPWLVIGGLAGWLAGKISKGRGFGLLGNMIIGILGAMLGGLVFSVLGLHAIGYVGSLVMATVGSLLLLYVLQSLNKKGGRRR